MAVTFAGLACGVASFEAARTGAWDIALRLILLAALADGIDGTVARLLHASGRIGKELDGLSDVVVFGAVPALLFLTRYIDAAEPAHTALLASAIVFLCSGAYRLARFQVDSRPETFCGLPITAAGVLLAATVAGPLSPPAPAAAVVTLLLAALMVSRVSFPTFTRWRRTLLAAMGASIVPIVIWPRGSTMEIVTIALFGIYLLSGLASHVLDRNDAGIVKATLDVS